MTTSITVKRRSQALALQAHDETPAKGKQLIKQALELDLDNADALLRLKQQLYYKIKNMYKQDIIEAHKRIEPYIHNTPVLSSTLINEIVGASVVFKCENFQKMGAFKMRGASNSIIQLSDEQRKRGVVTHSSGNFAQALALAAQSMGVKAYIVMPSTAPQVKKDAVKGYGGEIIESEPTLSAR